jgi:hypothetical protein
MVPLHSVFFFLVLCPLCVNHFFSATLNFLPRGPKIMFKSPRSKTMGASCDQMPTFTAMKPLWSVVRCSWYMRRCIYGWWRIEGSNFESLWRYIYGLCCFFFSLEVLFSFSPVIRIAWYRPGVTSFSRVRTSQCEAWVLEDRWLLVGRSDPESRQNFQIGLWMSASKSRQKGSTDEKVRVKVPTMATLTVKVSTEVPTILCSRK